ncbi:37S ribosomal S9 protein [Rutstroemia sp. NJR-2017a BBW]|nr:37S ribosomal S9 protein [Rutstroemia sp. NJR-2017a BBW]
MNRHILHTTLDTRQSKLKDISVCTNSLTINKSRRRGRGASISSVLSGTDIVISFWEQRQQQGYANYNADLMYNVAQQGPPNNVYESQQFQARQPAAMQMLSELPAPYFPNEATSTPAPPVLQHHASSSSSTVYQQHQQSPGDRASLLQQAYPPNIGIGGMPQATPDLIEPGSLQAQGRGMEEAYSTYQAALKQIFKNIIDGRLAEASQSLLEVSEWLLGHVQDLGLTVDEVTLHADRVRLWNEFNAAWKGIFTAQKDMLESGQRIQPPQALMTQEFITKMGNNLTRLCDVVEKYGLVDYQYGVAEEEIMDILLSCLQTQESIEGTDSEPSSAHPAAGRAPP